MNELEKRRRQYYKWKYGITLEDYDALRKSQDYKCKICERHESEINTRLIVDHNHQTKIIRGLICKSCNLNMSLMGDEDESYNLLKNEWRYR